MYMYIMYVCINTCRRRMITSNKATGPAIEDHSSVFLLGEVLDLYTVCIQSHPFVHIKYVSHMRTHTGTSETSDEHSHNTALRSGNSYLYLNNLVFHHTENKKHTKKDRSLMPMPWIIWKFWVIDILFSVHHHASSLWHNNSVFLILGWHSNCVYYLFGYTLYSLVLADWDWSM